jgi:hypothetical protein
MGADADATGTPYRTGTYLILDNNPERPARDGNFRSGRGLDPPLRASGSHQLDAAMFADIVDRIADAGPDLRRLLIVDLRQESHVFLDGRAVSWCADKDWSNVGQSTAWIRRDEQCQLEKLAAAPDQLVYAIQKDADGNIRVLGTAPVRITRTETEETLVGGLRSRLTVSYLRLPVTDHCAPESDAVSVFLEMLGNVDAATWVHFHCHGGDGRTTTFLTMYDMLGVAKTRSPIAAQPDLEYFRSRQLQLYHYDVRPNPATKRWQAPLSEVRWRRLESFRTFVLGGYASGQPWPGFAR